MDSREAVTMGQSSAFQNGQVVETGIGIGREIGDGGRVTLRRCSRRIEEIGEWAARVVRSR